MIRAFLDELLSWWPVVVFLAVVGAFAAAIYAGNQADERREQEQQQARDAAIARGDLRQVAPGLWAIRDRAAGVTCYASREWLGATVKNCVKD